MNEDEAPGMLLALREQAELRQDIPVVEPMQENVNVQPEDTAERDGESGGSTLGSIMSSRFYKTTSSRVRMGTTGGQKPPPGDELEGDEDLRKRFNGNRESYEEYKNLEGKSVIIDRGFDANFLTHGLISRMIREHEWTGFCMHHDEESNWELLREFYANINSTNGTTWVRGKMIRIDANSLNTFLGTKEQPGILTYELMNRNNAPNGNKEMVKRIAWSMCDGPPRFYGGGPTFPEKQVKVELKPSLDFYFSKLKPITHTHRISGISLYGLSEILLGKAVNVGEIIHKTMIKKVKGVLSHPNLIRRLCENAGVEFSEFVEDKNISIGGPIPLIAWTNQEEYHYELVPLPAEQQPNPQPEGDQSWASTPQSRRRAQPQLRGRKRQRRERGEERTVIQDEIPGPSEARIEDINAPGPQVPTPSQGTQFTELSQTLITLQREHTAAMERQLAMIIEGRLKEKELGIQARREEDERRIKADQEERERRAQEFQLHQLQLAAIFMGFAPLGNPTSIVNLMGSLAGRPSQERQPTTTPQAPTPQDPPSPASES